MKIAVALATAVLLSTPGTARGDRRHPAWLVGEWVTINPGEEFSQGMCHGDHNVVYDSHGRYDLMDENGRWHVERDRLIQTMTRYGGTGDDRDLNRPRSARIVKRSANAIRLLWPRGVETMVRCATR